MTAYPHNGDKNAQGLSSLLLLSSESSSESSDYLMTREYDSDKDNNQSVDSSGSSSRGDEFQAIQQKTLRLMETTMMISLVLPQLIPKMLNLLPMALLMLQMIFLIWKTSYFCSALFLIFATTDGITSA